MSSTNTPKLPTEVWLRILQHVNADKTELWTSLRHVSRAFKEGIETIFRERHLPQTFIHIDLGEHYYDDEDHYIKFNVAFKFSHLSPTDPNVAIFTIEDIAPRFRDEVCQRLKSWEAGNIPESPGHILQIRRDVNDTPLPNKKIAYNDLTLTLPWRELYTSFYCEEAYYNQLTASWVTDRERWALDLHKKMLRGEINMEQMMLRTIKEFAKGSEVNRERARGRRIEMQYRKDGLEHDWCKDGDEDQKREWRESVKRIRQVADLGDFSDDDHEGEEEGSDDEEDECENEMDSQSEEEEDDEEQEWEDAESDEEDEQSADRKAAEKSTASHGDDGGETLPVRGSNK